MPDLRLAEAQLLGEAGADAWDVHAELPYFALLTGSEIVRLRRLCGDELGLDPRSPDARTEERVQWDLRARDYLARLTAFERVVAGCQLAQVEQIEPEAPVCALALTVNSSLLFLADPGQSLYRLWRYLPLTRTFNDSMTGLGRLRDRLAIGEQASFESSRVSAVRCLAAGTPHQAGGVLTALSLGPRPPGFIPAPPSLGEEGRRALLRYDVERFVVDHPRCPARRDPERTARVVELARLIQKRADTDGPEVTFAEVRSFETVDGDLCIIVPRQGGFSIECRRHDGRWELWPRPRTDGQRIVVGAPVVLLEEGSNRHQCLGPVVRMALRGPR